MKISYNRDSDVLMLEISKAPIYHAEEVGSIIIHFTQDDKPVLLEILDASEFVSAVTRIGMKAKKEELVEARV